MRNGLAFGAPGELTPGLVGRKLRVLFVIESTIGGTKRHTLDLLRGFVQRDDVEAELACPMVRENHGGDTSFVNDAQALGILVHRIEMRRSLDPASDFRSLLQLWRLIHGGVYDIVHLHSSKAGALGRIATTLSALGGRRRPRVVYTPNGWSFLIPGSRARGLFYEGVERLLAPITDRLIVVSEDERREALRRHVVREDRTRLVRSGVDPEILPDGDAGDRKRREMGWGRRNEEVVVGTVARLTLQKDPFTLLRAAARVLEEAPEARFVWIGHGELEPEFLRLARELSLHQHPRFEYLGFREDGRELIAALDIFALSSVFEAGLPYVLMEAMAIERPVVAVAGSGSRELITHEKNGLLVPMGDPRALASEIVRLTGNPTLRRELARAGRQTVLGSCTVRNQVDETWRVYEEALC